MRMNNDLERRFNTQITLEFEASMVYRQLAIEMEVQNLTGSAAWLRAQAGEEIVHANKFIDHLADRDNHPRIGQTNAPQVAADSMLAAFQAALAHEQKVSAAIRDLVRAAEGEGDLDSRPLLNWFLSEQLEEEATVQQILGRIALTADDGPGLLRLDEELAQRPMRSSESGTA